MNKKVKFWVWAWKPYGELSSTWKVCGKNLGYMLCSENSEKKLLTKIARFRLTTLHSGYFSPKWRNCMKLKCFKIPVLIFFCDPKKSLQKIKPRKPALMIQKSWNKNRSCNFFHFMLHFYMQIRGKIKNLKWILCKVAQVGAKVTPRNLFGRYQGFQKYPKLNGTRWNFCFTNYPQF